MLHQAWSDGSFFPISNRSAAAGIEPGAVLVWSIEAASWAEAMTQYHLWKGWAPYVPMDDDLGEYSSEDKAAN